MSTLEPFAGLGLRRSAWRWAQRRVPAWPALVALWLALVLGSSASSAHAQVPFFCPLDPYLYPAKCAKLARREQRALERQARDDAIHAYREAHAWRVSALADGSVFGLGLGNSYVVGGWAAGVGVSVLHEIVPAWTLRIGALARFGRGHIKSWNGGFPGDIKRPASFMGGAELRLALLRRMRSLYLGPAVSLGYLHLQPQTLHAVEDYGFTGTIRVPANAPSLAAGIVFGGEPIPQGRYSISLHLTAGVWNDMRHPYLSAAVALTVKLWD